ncbi:protein tyrosine phosphatase [Variovorax sp. J2P1-59]|uniref:arsenate reductase/protein-tyrosine-phosphatase family protein n=1 Tax=Variovorax flavidus TaxID=3053501 RepID=UPI002577A437|nr:protein tyrosine phosphatase [Variovorax sp. J2P1-59]MDM0076006.1 protein tyrosine phosphatase [Variovorax sp. J2P1-59]
MIAKRFVVIFVSRRNSLRSILAQACLAHLGRDRFSAYSCGHPAHVSDRVHPAAIAALASAGMPVPLSQPHGWDDMIRWSSPHANFVITLDETTLPVQPNWPGQPDAALWSFPDIAALDSAGEIDRAALQMLYALRRRLELLTSLPLHSADPAAIRSDVRDLAHMQ